MMNEDEKNAWLAAFMVFLPCAAFSLGAATFTGWTILPWYQFAGLFSGALGMTFVIWLFRVTYLSGARR